MVETENEAHKVDRQWENPQERDGRHVFRDVVGYRQEQYRGARGQRDPKILGAAANA